MSYDKSSDMITWELFFIDKDKAQVFAYPSDDMKTAIGISEDIDQEDWSFFCDSMINKEFSLVLPVEENENDK